MFYRLSPGQINAIEQAINSRGSPRVEVGVIGKGIVIYKVMSQRVRPEEVIPYRAPMQKA